jgi:hypothetical protein
LQLSDSQLSALDFDGQLDFCFPLSALILRFPAPVRQVLCFAFALVYCVIGVYGTFIGESAMFKIVPGVVEFHAGDYTNPIAGLPLSISAFCFQLCVFTSAFSFQLLFRLLAV